MFIFLSFKGALVAKKVHRHHHLYHECNGCGCGGCGGSCGWCGGSHYYGRRRKREIEDVFSEDKIAQIYTKVKKLRYLARSQL